MKKEPREYRTFGRSRSVRLPREVYSQVDTMYFVTVCCLDKSPFLVKEQVAVCVFRTWREVIETHGQHLWGLCVMPDHLHALVEIRNESKGLDKSVSTAKSLSVTRLCGAGRLHWQDRFHDHVLRRDEDFRVRARYLAEKPVRKGLVNVWDEWPWTYLDDTIRW